MQVEEVLAYVIGYLVGDRLRFVKVLPGADCVMDETTPGSGIMRGILPDTNGKMIEIPLDLIRHVFQTKYRVTANWSGQGHKTVDMDENQIAENAERISRIATTEGETVYKKYESFDDIKAEREAKKKKD